MEEFKNKLGFINHKTNRLPVLFSVQVIYFNEFEITSYCDQLIVTVNLAYGTLKSDDPNS